MNPNENKKVFVAMSGGVDSSVAAWLLKYQGYKVTGVHFLMAKFNTARVKKICQKLKIPLLIWDFRREFKKRIVDIFIKQYKKELTPNPCIFCNRLIKFGLFYEKAKKAEADFIATGHYVRIIRKNGRYILKKGLDKKKDQSYFLWDLKPRVLSHCLFPLGGLNKDKVKKLVAKHHIPAAKSESQEICFVSGNISDYLIKKINGPKGLIRDFQSNNILGRHQGLFLYTIGQRSGLGLSGGPWYVVNKDVNHNVVWVTNQPSALLGKEIRVSCVNWLVKPKSFPLTLTVKPRYRHPGAKAKIIKIGKIHTIIFDQPERALTPGQSAVFYRSDLLLGGGIIK